MYQKTIKMDSSFHQNIRVYRKDADKLNRIKRAFNLAGFDVALEYTLDLVEAYGKRGRLPREVLLSAIRQGYIEGARAAQIEQVREINTPFEVCSPVEIADRAVDRFERGNPIEFDQQAFELHDPPRFRFS